MNMENVMNDDELMNITGGKEVDKNNQHLLFKGQKKTPTSATFTGQSHTVTNLVMNEKESDKDFDGMLLVGETGIKC